MSADKFQNWRRGEPTQTLPGADASRLQHWRRGEPIIGLDLTVPPVVITGTGSFTAPASILTGTGTVTAAAVAGRHALSVRRVPVPIRGRGRLAAPGAVLRGAGTVNDDDLVLQLLDL